MVALPFIVSVAASAATVAGAPVGAESIPHAGDLWELTRKGDAAALARHAWCASAAVAGGGNFGSRGGDGRGSSPLSVAVSYGHVPAARALLRCGITDAQTAASQAAASVDARAGPPHAASAEDVARRLAVRDLMGQTPLHIAARQGHVGLVVELLQWRADAAARDRAGLAPLFSAAQRGHAAVLEVLLVPSGRGVHVGSDRLGRSALHLAAWAGHDEVVERLIVASSSRDNCSAGNATCSALEARDLGGRTAIQLAAAHGHVVVTQHLLEARAAPWTLDGEGRSPLHSVASRCDQELARLLLLARPEGHSVDIADRRGRTPLHGAASSGCASVAHMLKSHQAHIKAADLQGSTPVGEAVKAGHARVLAALGTRLPRLHTAGISSDLLKQFVKGLDGFVGNLLDFTTLGA